jgi:SM-20-related protein
MKRGFAFMGMPYDEGNSCGLARPAWHCKGHIPKPSNRWDDAAARKRAFSLRGVSIMSPAVVTPETAPSRHSLSSMVVEALAGPGWCAIPDFLDRRGWWPLAMEARLIHAQGGFRHAGIGRGESFRIRPEIRNDRVHWIDPLQASDLQLAWLQRVELLRQDINRELKLGLFGFETHFALYPEGSFYLRHLDRFADAAYRRVTCILYLNDDWQPDDGGQLRIYLPNGSSHVDILPQGGTTVFFLSGEFEHEVLPARRERLSLTGWYCQRR